MPLESKGREAMFGRLRERAAAGGRYALKVKNPTEYAVYLQDREAITVIDVDHLRETARENARDLVASSLPVTERNVLLALDKAGFDEVAWLRSLTGETAPSVRNPETGEQTGPRRKHPTGFADVTTQLAGAYEHEPARKL